MRYWFDCLCSRRPSFGYFPEPSKTVLIVGPTDHQSAIDLFSNLGVRVMAVSRFLGRKLSCDEFILSKVEGWCRCVKQFSVVAALEPLADFAAMSRSFQFEWNHVQHVVPRSLSLFAILSLPFIPPLLREI